MAINKVPEGPAIEITWGEPHPVLMRARDDDGKVMDLPIPGSSLMIRIGPAGATRLIEQTLANVDPTTITPQGKGFGSGTIPADATKVAPGEYEYRGIVIASGRSFVRGVCTVVDPTRAAT